MKPTTRFTAATMFALALSLCAMHTQAEEQPAGQTVSGKLVVPENDLGFTTDYTLGGFMLVEQVAIPRVTVPADVRAKSPAEQRAWYAEWLKSDEGKAHTAKVMDVRKNQQKHKIEVAEDGSFKIENVKPGNYTLTASVFADADAQKRREAGAQLQKRITIADKEMELGDLPMQINRNLKIGDVAPTFEVKTVDGDALNLADYKGKYVLVDFWAVWCGPCRGETPHLKAAYEKFGGNENFEIIGLSLDKETDKPIAYAKEHELGWVNGFLGSWGEDKVAKSYGVRGIPSIWLIGPDGKILAKGLRGPKIAEAIGEHVKPAESN